MNGYCALLVIQYRIPHQAQKADIRPKSTPEINGRVPQVHMQKGGCARHMGADDESMMMRLGLSTFPSLRLLPTLHTQRPSQV